MEEKEDAIFGSRGVKGDTQSLLGIGVKKKGEFFKGWGEKGVLYTGRRAEKKEKGSQVSYRGIGIAKERKGLMGRLGAEGLILIEAGSEIKW